MQSEVPHKAKSFGAFGDLAMLLLASLAVVTVLTIAVAGGGGRAVGGLSLGYLLLLSTVAGGGLLAAAAVWRSARAVRQAHRKAANETAVLRRSLATAESIIKGEPQVLVFWEQGQGLKVVTYTLTTVAGLPEAEADFLRFGTWLEAKSAEDLKAGLDALFAEGRPFNLLLRTNAGGNVEADGRAAGGRAILRLRDVAGYKRDLARILEQHRALARDIRACRAMLNALPMPVWLRGPDGRLEWVNTAYVKAVEATDDAEVLQRQVELLESRQRETVTATIAKSQTFQKRLPLIIKGERKAHDVMVLPLDGATAGAATDAAALETARGELERRIAAYDRTLDRVATAVAIFGPDQRLTFFNDAFRRLWQLDANWLESGPRHGEILDRLRELSRLPEVVSYRDWKARVLAMARSSTEQEDWWHLPDGRTLHVLGEQRNDGGVTCLYDDVSERLALESRYNALIDVQRETLDHLKEGVAVFGTDGRLKLYNTALAQIWKLSRQTLGEGPHIEEIVRLCSVLSDDDKSWSTIGRAVTVISDRRQPVEGQMRRPDGSVIDFAALPLPDGATLVTFSDVTDAKRYERALIERNEALVAADRLKSQCISHVSYELRTPLTNIIGFTELLSNIRTGSLNPKQTEYLSDIAGSSKTLLSIIDDILDLATIDAGALELHVAPANVRAITEAAALGVRERLARARLTLDMAIADDAVELIADENRVRQVLYNLLSNAIGFSKAGDTITLSVWREHAMMAFAIQDQGVGIPKDQQRRVFAPFESKSRGSKHRGAGLGLTIVKSLVELHGGDMLLDSEPGRGTRVVVRFPEAGPRRPQPVEGAAKALSA